MLLLISTDLFLESVSVLEVGVVLQHRTAVIRVARELALEVERRTAVKQVAASWFLLNSFCTSIHSLLHDQYCARVLLLGHFLIII